MNEQLSFNATIEIDQAQSMKNIKKVVDDIGKSTAIEIKGFNIDPNTLSKQLQSAMKQTFNFNKDTGLNSLTSVIKGAYGEILTVQQSVDEHGKTIIENAKLTTDTLKAQKARYEEIRVLYEKLGKLQLDNMTASEKKKKDIADEIKETQKLIRQKEKALKADESMINASLQENVIDKQKLKNSIAIAKEEDKITKRKESAYARLRKAWELIHKYEMQSVGANEKDLEVLNRKKAVAEQLRAKIQGTINLTGLGDKDLKEDIDTLREIQALELKVAKHAHEEKTLNTELVALDNKRLATKKQLEMATAGTKEYAVLEKQLEQQALAVLQKKAEIDEKGVTNQKVLNSLAEKELALQNQLEVSKARQEDAREREEKAVERLIAKTQKSMGIDLDNLLARKSDYMTTKDKQSIEGIRTKLNELNGTSLEDVKNQIAHLKLELKEVSSAISNTEFKQATSLIDELGNGFKRLTDYVVGTMVVDKLWDVFREGVVYLKELDDAYADVAISMNITREEFDGWVSDARKIAQANGVMTTSVMDMVKIYATSGESISQIQDKLAGTAMIQNITQWDAEKTTSVVNSIINQYKLLDKEINGTTGSVSGAIEYMGDALIGVSNALKVDNVTGIQEIASAIDAAGGVMEQAGASMEWYMGVTGTLNETMNATGSEIGNAMKMISARVFAQAQAMEELGESAENIPVEMRKAEKALTSVGVSIRDASDPSKLRDLEEIMDELAGKWQNLSDATKNFVAEGVAGTNRRNYFVSMMENYERVTELTKEGLNAQGALAEANEIRVKSLAGQINILKDNLMSLMDGFTPVLYGGTQLANAILNVVNAIGTVPTATAIATQAFLSFNKTGQLLRDNLFAIAEGYSPMIKRANEYISTMEIEKTRLKDLIAQKKLDIEETKANIIAKKALNESTTQLNAKLKAEQTELKATQLQLAVATAKTVALQAVMSAGLSLAIGAIVGGLSHLVSNLNMSSEQMGDLTSRAKDLKDSLDVDISGLVSEYERLGKLAEDSTKTEKEKLYYHEEMAKVREELVAIDSGYAAILNDETKSLETQLNLIKAQREEKLKDEGAKLDKDLGFDWTHNNRVDSLEGDLKLQYDALLKYKELYDQIKGTDAKTVINPITGYEQSVDQFLNNFENMKEAFKENYAEADRLNGIIKVIGESGHESGKKMVEGLSQYDEMYNSLHKGTLDAVGASAEELNTTYKTVEDLTMGLRNTFESLSAGKLSYSDVLEDVRSAFQQIGSEAGAQEGIVEDFLNVFPKYSGAIEDTSDILALFGDKAVIELGKAQAEAKNFLETMKDAENYTPDLAEQLLEAYPELAGHIQDTAYVQEFLNDKIAEMDSLYGVVMSQVDVHRTAQEEILANDAEFWNQKMKNSENFVQYQNAIESKLIQMGADSLGIQYADFAAFVESKGGLRDVDYTNATTLAEAENMTEAQKLMSMLQNYVAYVNEKDGYRGVDSQLIADFLNWQGATEVQTVEELKQVWASFYNAKKAALQKEISQLTKFDETLHAYGEYDTSAYQASMQLQKLNKMNQQIMGATDLFGGIKTTFKGVGAKYNGGGGIGSSGLNTNPSSGSSNSGKDKQDTEQVVEDLELVIDRYYELNDAIDDVNNKLELNRQLQANAKDLNTTKKLHKEEIELLKEKLEATKKLQAEQEMDRTEQKNTLTSAGFKFDKEGNITNYSSQLKAMEKYANSLTGEAKEAQIAYVNSIVEVIDAYTSLSNDTIPSTEIAIQQLLQEIEEVNKEHEKTIQLIETLGDRYYEINGQITDVENRLALVRAKQENATPSERVKLLEEEIALMKERQQLITQQKSELEAEANEIAKKLAEKGVEFNADGTIKNYKQLMQNLTTVANQYVGDTRDEMVDDAETLLDLIEQYDDIIRNTLPELAVEWEEYTASIREAEKAMAEQVTEVQKNVTSAIENELQKRTEAVKSELQKQKDAYNKQFEEEDWEDSLSEEQRKLDEIQQAINNMSRDTSLAGQLKLQQLREEYEAQQKVIDDMIRDKEKENGNNRFDEEMEKLDEELEKALDPQNIADLVNKALVDGFVTIGDEVMALDTLMSDWLNETGDGLYAIGDTLREELIDNLRVAQELMAGMGIIQTGVSSVDQNALLKDAENQLSATLNTSGVKGQGQNLEIAIGSLLEVKGNVTEDVLPKLESMIETAKSELIEEITYEMMRR